MADRSWKRGSQRHFVIRCWLEAAPGAQPAWRGRVQEVGGAAAAFRDVEGLVAFLVERLRIPEGVELPRRADP